MYQNSFLHHSKSLWNIMQNNWRQLLWLKPRRESKGFTYQTSSKDFELKQKPWVSGKENYWYTEGQLTQYSWRSFMNNLIIFNDRESNSSTFHITAKFHIPVSTNNKFWFPLPVPQKQKQVCFHSFITVPWSWTFQPPELWEINFYDL